MADINEARKLIFDAVKIDYGKLNQVLEFISGTENSKEVVPCGQCKSCVNGETVYDMFCVELERNCYAIGYCGLGQKKEVE